MTLFAEGYIAETRGKAEADCPYTGRKRAAWLKGYRQSKAETFEPQGVPSRSPHDYP